MVFLTRARGHHHPRAGVIECAVIGIKDARWGDRPLALIVRDPKTQPPANEDDVKAHVNGLLWQGHHFKIRRAAENHICRSSRTDERGQDQQEGVAREIWRCSLASAEQNQTLGREAPDQTRIAGRVPMTNNPDANDPRSESISDQASRSTLALNPLVGLRRQGLVDSTMILLNAIAREPAVAVNQLLEFLGEMGNVVAGKSERKPEAGDKRFADKTWKDSAVHRGLLQAYLAWGDSLNKFIDQTSLSDINKTRPHLVASMFIDAAAPTNNLLSNPAAVRQFFDTGGSRLRRRGKH